MSQQPVYRTGPYVAGGGIPTGNKRHIRKLKADNILGVTKPAIRRIARRGGVKRIKFEIYDTTRAVLRSRLEDILRRIILTIRHAGAAKGGREEDNGRKTVTTEDVVFALNQMGTPIYGFEWYKLGQPAPRKRVRAGKNLD